MASKPQQNSPKGSSEDASDRQSLPFEPKRRKPTEKKAASKSVNKPVKQASVASVETSTKARQRSGLTAGIPDAVSRRMVRRMALFSGIPTLLGMSTFVVSYLIVSRDLFELPTYAVLLVSLGWFGLGVVGLSYGLLSASWEEGSPGSALGWSEFTTNWGRMTEAWRSKKSQ